MTVALLNHMTRPIGPPLPAISFEAFLDELRVYRAVSLPAGMTTFSWRAWRGDFPTDEANAMAVALAGRMAVLGLACGGLDGKEPSERDLANLHFRYLAIDAASDDLHGPLADELARVARNEPIAIMIPDIESAGRAVAAFTVARLLRVQWLPARTRLHELSRTWWIARRLDAHATQLDRTTQMLGMHVPTFVRAASALLGLAVASEPQMGRVDLNRPVDQAFVDKYDVDADALRVAAFKLATSRDELQVWLGDLLANSPPGLRHDAPTPLSVTPLLRGDDLVGEGLSPHTLFLCPSLYHFMGAVRDRVKEAISAPGPTGVDTALVYGEILSEYVGQALASTRCLNVDAFDGDDRRCDWLAVEDDVGLFIEVKRAIATGALSRHLLTANGMGAVLGHLYGAYDQRRATWSRGRWRQRCGALRVTAAVILIDEPVGGEGAVLGDLLSRQTQIGVELPFEVMSVAEFENALSVLGLRRLVGLIRDKWERRLAGLPLAVFWTKVLGQQRLHVEHAPNHLDHEDEELFLRLKLSVAAAGADWPL